MATKKKHKPRFDVTEAVETAPQSGWVYRSEEGTPEPPAAPHVSIEPKPASGLVNGIAVTVAYGAAAAGQVFLAGTRVIAMPITVGLRLLGLR